jgi:hypothetical protein
MRCHVCGKERSRNNKVPFNAARLDQHIRAAHPRAYPAHKMSGCDLIDEESDGTYWALREEIGPIDDFDVDDNDLF